MLPSLLPPRTVSCIAVPCQGIATGISVTGENNSIWDSRIDSPQALEIFGAKNRIVGSNISGSTAIRINRTSQTLISGCQISALQGVLIEVPAGI